MINLNNNVALVTGASQGLGKGIAIELANVGTDVIVTHLNTPSDAKNAEAVVDEIIEKGRKAIALSLDVTNEKSIEQCVQEALKQFPNIDILVNNAGVFQNKMGGEATLEDFDVCHDVNVKGVWSVSCALIHHFLKNGGGKIINIASGAGRRGHVANAYCASKAAVISLTQSLAEELGPSNINVNAVCPCIVRTPALDRCESMMKDEAGDMPSHVDRCIEITPLRRMQTAEDIGCAVVFFASPQAKNITGQALNVDGGFCMN